MQEPPVTQSTTTLLRVMDQLTGTDPELALAAEALLVAWGPSATHALAEALARAPLAVRPRVVGVLRRRAGPASLTALENATLLARHLQQEAAAEFQIALLEAIQALGDSRSIHAILRLLTVRHPAVQLRVVAALVPCGKVAVPGLISAISSSYSSVREEAATALGEVGDFTAIDALHAALTSPRDPYKALATRAALALGRLAEREPSLRLKAAVPMLRYHSMGWQTDRPLLEACRWALARITEAVRFLESTPIPASAPCHPAKQMPIPGTARPDR